MQPILFFNTAWMDFYEGINENTEIYGGGSYVEKYGYGHEIYNFKKINGKVYGYVQPNGRNNLERLGVSKDAEKISGVLLIFTATHKNGGTFIVGWYKNATVYRDYQETTMKERKYLDEYLGYYAEANAEDAVLLNRDERITIFEPIPRGKGGMGHSNVWYADADNMKDFRNRVTKFIDNYKKKKLERKTLLKRCTDIDLKKKVETEAVKKVTDYYSDLGYDVKSVEKDNVGWDLEVKQKRTLLKVEVKGTSSGDVSVELTSNEYKNMNLYKDSYRLAIVTNVLAESVLYVFSFSKEKDNWVDDKGNILEIENIISARCFI
ncbi:DUF3883 domain-containing protein [Clostridium sp. JN-1]|uniref:DUF3883 domain-containing protein n=1 Tax=Clostridium sp. JN-1 TaxID=2483110 RepID=UPI001680F365|nr:DUF3883 domain-containing protein [Clostridium sp. JN-1]